VRAGRRRVSKSRPCESLMSSYPATDPDPVARRPVLIEIAAVATDGQTDTCMKDGRVSQLIEDDSL